MHILIGSRFLITGATGFVGSHLALYLWNLGADLRLMLRPTSDLSRLPHPIYNAILEADPRIELVEGDLTDSNSLTGIADGVEAIFHLACAVKGTFDEDQDSQYIFYDVNVRGTQNIAREAIRAKKRLIHISSTAAMGPLTQSYVDESTECQPQAPYQISKYQAEVALMDLHRSDRLDVIILRPCLILGPGKQGGEMLQFFKLIRRGIFPKLSPSMQCTKPLIDVRDVAHACAQAVELGKSGEIYLIHSGGNHTMENIIEAARRIVGSKRAGINVPVAPVRTAASGFEQLAKWMPSFSPPVTNHRLDLFLQDRNISIDKSLKQLLYKPQHQDIYDMLGMTYIGYVRDGQLVP